VGAKAAEAQRSDSDLLRLDCEEAETRLSKGRKGALPPVPPVRLCSFAVSQSQGILQTGSFRVSCDVDGTLWVHRSWLAAVNRPIPDSPRPALNAISLPALTEWRE